MMRISDLEKRFPNETREYLKYLARSFGSENPHMLEQGSLLDNVVEYVFERLNDKYNVHGGVDKQYDNYVVAMSTLRQRENSGAVTGAVGGALTNGQTTSRPLAALNAITGVPQQLKLTATAIKHDDLSTDFDPLPEPTSKSWKVSKKTEGFTSTDNVCTICLDEISMKKREVLKCAHKFHKKCISDWLLRDNTCPTCRDLVLANEDFPELT